MPQVLRAFREAETQQRANSKSGLFQNRLGFSAKRSRRSRRAPAVILLSSPRGAGGGAAVHDQQRSRHIARRIRRQEDAWERDLLDPPETFQRARQPHHLL